MQRPFGRCTTMFWRYTMILVGGRAARPKCPSWDLLWQCVVNAGDVYKLGTLPSSPGAAVQKEKSGAITQTAGFCSCKGWQKVPNEKCWRANKHHVAAVPALCWVPACTSVPGCSRACALQAGPEPAFASVWNVLDCLHKVAWIQPEFIIPYWKLKLISKESFCTKFFLAMLKNI